MSKLTGISMFTGGGLCDIGLRDLVDFIGGVEFDQAIAAHASLALGHPVLCASVCDVDYRQWAGVDYLHMSPPCTNASVANANAGETDNDTALSGACCRAIREIRPRFVTLENVAGYAQFTAFQDILECLDSEGYKVHWRVYDAADFGVPQHRKRIMLRARRDGLPIPEVLPTHGSPKDVEASRVQMKMFEETLLPWNGWYAAVEDLLPGCPETALAPWQIKRLSAQYGDQWLDNILIRYAGEASEVAGTATSPTPTLTADGCNKSRAVLVESQGCADTRSPTRSVGDEPSWTVRTNRQTEIRAVMVNGEAGGKNGLRGLYTPATTRGDEPLGTVKSAQCGMKAILVEGDACGERCPTVLPPPEQRSVPIGSGGGRVHRAILVGGANRSQSFLDFAQEFRKNIPGVKEADEPIFGVSSTSSSDIRALLIDGDNAGKNGPIVHQCQPPVGTVSIQSRPSVILPDPPHYRIVALTPRCLARFQSVPDDYPLPTKKSLATKIIGNGVACQAARAIFGPMLEGKS